MTIESTNKDIHRGVHPGIHPGLELPQSGWWENFKRWCGGHPRLSRIFFIGLGLALLALLIWAIYPKPAPRRGFNNGPQPVGVATAQDAPINITLNALGTVTPLATATVRPQVGGMLIKLYFTEGQMVKAGDLLAQIDPRPYQAALDQAKGQLARDQANLANARVDLARYQGLAAQNAISNQQLDTQSALVRADSGIVQTDQANVETAEINLGYTRITSPVAGRVGLHLVDVGNIVSAGQTTGIVVVTELAPISVIFTVPEDNISQVMGRAGSGATLTVDAFDRSQTTKIASGALATIDNVIDPTTGTVKLRAMFDNADGKLFPSQFVNVRLLVDTLQHQTVIPVSAIQRGADGTFVFVVSPDKVANQRSVKLGVQDGDKVAVLEGLKPGDTVVVDGADRLRDGAEVSIPGPAQRIQAPSAGAAPASTAARGQVQAALIQACSADIAKLCAGQSGGAARRCLAQNRSSL
ncbi:MAG TPA: MdtA/MuxA family multidrug efflux RND transporter periplasmic adaptor subunit, partial [Rhizomicrobium sp.]|nr:MdtA/MuxA family multidrug efflux RND transporter periplasmic adaptor subunit [Rhizomicrobium sp.]